LSYYPYPTDWKDLQRKTAKLLSECGFHTEIEKPINTCRGNVAVDVYVENSVVIPKSIYLIECKYWENSIPQSIIHSFRTVVTDYGANHGYIITKKGFQKGAYAASSKTNIELLTWEEFIELFKQTWKERMFWRIFNRYNNISYYRGGYVGDLLEKKHISQELNINSKKNYEDLIQASNVFINDKHLFPDFILSVKNEEIKFPSTLKILNDPETYKNESQLFDKIILEQDKLLFKFDEIFKKKIRKIDEIWG